MSHEEVIEPVKRDGWGKGPWDGEPDKLQWKTESGLVGLIVRNHSGALCGYVGLPPGHPQYEVHYLDLEHLDVHGGPTYSSFCVDAICHVPDPGEPEKVWWVGFDCSHGGDLVPGFLRFGHLTSFPLGGTYKNVAYVKSEVEQLAKQLSVL